MPVKPSQPALRRASLFICSGDALPRLSTPFVTIESVTSSTLSRRGPVAAQKMRNNSVEARSSPTLMCTWWRHRRASNSSHCSGEANQEAGNTVRSKGIHVW